MKTRLLTTLFLLFSFLAWGQDFQAGGEDRYLFLSPFLLGQGGTTVGGLSVMGDILNPALSGDVQRTTLDINYAGILDTTSGFSYPGNAASLGLTVPTRAGVWTASANFLTSSSGAYNYGTMGGFNFSFAKDLYSNLLVGAGISSTLGIRPDNVFDWSAGLSLGFIHKLQSLNWGVSLRDMGKTWSFSSQYPSLPSMFTLSTGAEWFLLDSEDFSLDLLSDLSFPSFQDVKYNLGVRAGIGNFLTLSTSVEGSVRDYMDGNFRLPIPTISLSMNFLTDLGDSSEFLQERGWAQSEINPSFGFGYLKDGTMAVSAGLNLPLGVIDVNPPEITVVYNEEQYISPNNDGKNDLLSFKISITDERYIRQYRLEIKNEAGELVRTIRNKDARPESDDWQNLIDRLFYVKEGIPIPETLSWDGRMDDGTIAPNGAYSFTLISLDDNDNEGRSGPFTLYVDNTTPEVAIEELPSNDLIFSPNGDGNKDLISFSLAGSEEDVWQLDIINSLGTTVKTFRFEDQAPEEYTWDGTDNSGSLLPDGVYSLRVSTSDRARNYSAAQLDNIILSTEITPVTLILDEGYFSPNADNVQDTITFDPQVPIRGGVKNWWLRVLNEQDRVSWEITGTQADLPNEPIEFDGKNFRGELLPEGVYRAQMELDYLNGNNPVSTSPDFVLDVTAPSVSVLIEGLPSFSPDGDGQRDEISYLQTGSDEVTWIGEVRDANTDDVVRTQIYAGRPSERFIWDGLGDDGNLQADGEYYYVLSTTDRAGNSGNAMTGSFNLDTQARSAILTVQGAAFSPNADGVQDRIGFTPRVNINTGITRYNMNILNGNSEVVRTFSGSNTIPESLSWDGLDDSGSRLSEGTYSARLGIQYGSGSTVEALSNQFILDISFPEATISSDLVLFSPNGDGFKDEIKLIQSSSSEDLWESNILDSNGDTIREFSWQGMTEDQIWDGTDRANNPVANGIYSYILSSQDPAGNRSEFVIPSLEVDNRTTNTFLTVQEPFFGPGANETMLTTNTFGLVATLNEGMESWILEMVHETQGAVMEFYGEESLPASIQWDGMGAGGVFLEGEYRARLAVVYKKGDQVEQVSSPFILDTEAPQTIVNINPRPFSPDNDGNEDELTIGLQVTDQVGVASWSFVITDPQGNYFQEFSGESEPARSFTWDGRSLNGELVQAAVDYPFELTMTDKLGQTSVEEGLIPVDILVIRDGDRYKIAVPSITFAPNSPELVFDETEAGIKNRQVLQRLSEILQRYNRYQIEIEGHAVSVFWADAARAAREEQEELQPLSEQRATRVRNALEDLGVNVTNYTVVGMGGTDPVVPHGDEENRWKNRRVEFILVR